MEKLLKRVHELEVEIQKLKSQLAPGNRQTVQVVKKSIGFVLTYWTLLSFLVAILVALYIKYSFDVDYFENYRTLAGSRKISNFHTKLGDRLLLRQEWAAAEDAYTKALGANPNNAEASYGLVKSRIWKAPPGEKFPSPETQDTMLQFLRAEKPEDPDLDLLQAWRYWEQSDPAGARSSAEAALKKNPKFATAQLLLGHISMSEGDLDTAADWCRKALESQPDFANALSNLGFIVMLQQDFPGAAGLLEQANRLSPSALTGVVLSDVYRLSGNYAGALAYSRTAAAMLNDEKFAGTRIVGGEWLYNYLPESKDDKQSWKSGIYASGLPRKQAIAMLANALDNAFNDDFPEADRNWARALKQEPAPELRLYMANKIRATINLGPKITNENLAAWLTARLTELGTATGQ